jgi:hypothetical protein
MVPFGLLGHSWTGGSLVLWQLQLVLDLEPGDVVFFMGRLIAHNTTAVAGTRNSMDLSTHEKVETWAKLKQAGSVKIIEKRTQDEENKVERKRVKIIEKRKQDEGNTVERKMVKR